MESSALRLKMRTLPPFGPALPPPWASAASRCTCARSPSYLYSHVTCALYICIYVSIYLSIYTHTHTHTHRHTDTDTDTDIDADRPMGRWIFRRNPYGGLVHNLATGIHMMFSSLEVESSAVGQAPFPPCPSYVRTALEDRAGLGLWT